MPVEVGQEAPDFTLRDHHGQQVTLSSFRGSTSVMVVFYPFAFSGICTGELCEIRDAMPQLDNDDVVLLAVSCDPMAALRAFADQERLTYRLLSDFWPHGAVAQAYGVFNDAVGSAIRATYVIDRDGTVTWKVENGMGDARSLEDYRVALAAL
jgi:peroxiredoxin